MASATFAPNHRPSCANRRRSRANGRSVDGCGPFHSVVPVLRHNGRCCGAVHRVAVPFGPRGAPTRARGPFCIAESWGTISSLLVLGNALNCPQNRALSSLFGPVPATAARGPPALSSESPPAFGGPLPLRCRSGAASGCVGWFRAPGLSWHMRTTSANPTTPPPPQRPSGARDSAARPRPPGHPFPRSWGPRDGGGGMGPLCCFLPLFSGTRRGRVAVLLASSPGKWGLQKHTHTHPKPGGRHPLPLFWSMGCGATPPPPFFAAASAPSPPAPRARKALWAPGYGPDLPLASGGSGPD